MSKDSNRNAMPTVAAIVDEYRKHFPDLKVVYAKEGNTVIDKRGDESNAFPIPRDYRLNSADIARCEGRKVIHDGPGGMSRQVDDECLRCLRRTTTRPPRGVWMAPMPAPCPMRLA